MLDLDPGLELGLWSKMSRCQGITKQGVQCANSAGCHWHANLGECSICLEKITQSTLFKTDCNHAFHSDCIHQWMEQSVTCPLCRAGMNVSCMITISVFINRGDGPVRNLFPLFNFIADLQGVPQSTYQDPSASSSQPQSV